MPSFGIGLQVQHNEFRDILIKPKLSHTCFLLTVLAVVSSVLTLTFIATDRFFAIVYPLSGRITHTQVHLCIFIIWCISVAIAMPHLFVRQVVTFHWKNRDEIQCDEIWQKYYSADSPVCDSYAPGKIAYYIVQGIVMFFCPILIITLAYGVICKTLWRHKPPGEQLGNLSTPEKTKRKVDQQNYY